MSKSAKSPKTTILPAGRDFCDCGRPVLMHLLPGPFGDHRITRGCLPCNRAQEWVLPEVDRLFLHSYAGLTKLPEWLLFLVCRHRIEGGPEFALDVRQIARRFDTTPGAVERCLKARYDLPLKIEEIPNPKRGRGARTIPSRIVTWGPLWTWMGSYCTAEWEPVVVKLLWLDPPDGAPLPAEDIPAGEWFFYEEG